jgi:hypothetical protein
MVRKAVIAWRGDDQAKIDPYASFADLAILG